MDDIKGKPVPVVEKGKGVTGYRGSGIGAGVVEVEDEDEKRFKTELEGAKDWERPGIQKRHERLRADKAARKAAAAPSPSPTATAVPEMPKKP